MCTFCFLSTRSVWDNVLEMLKDIDGRSARSLAMLTGASLPPAVSKDAVAPPTRMNNSIWHIACFIDSSGNLKRRDLANLACLRTSPMRTAMLALAGSLCPAAISMRNSMGPAGTAAAASLDTGDVDWPSCAICAARINSQGSSGRALIASRRAATKGVASMPTAPCCPRSSSIPRRCAVKFEETPICMHCRSGSWHGTSTSNSLYTAPAKVKLAPPIL
mmetsp:Transcript_39012/g.110663  ORF Transcript_39012/g.110663 Transcript_39012/m.110663 type:complete len:219 (+) Transcript_39012:335-991(+)